MLYLCQFQIQFLLIAHLIMSVWNFLSTFILERMTKQPSYKPMSYKPMSYKPMSTHLKHCILTFQTTTKTLIQNFQNAIQILSANNCLK